MGRISGRGLRWNANRMNHLPMGGGVFVVFDDVNNTFEVHECDSLVKSVRKMYWKRAFWHFSWFVTDPPEYFSKLKEKLEKMSYDDMWNFSD